MLALVECDENYFKSEIASRGQVDSLAFYKNFQSLFHVMKVVSVYTMQSCTFSQTNTSPVLFIVDRTILSTS